MIGSQLHCPCIKNLPTASVHIEEITFTCHLCWGHARSCGLSATSPVPLQPEALLLAGNRAVKTTPTGHLSDRHWASLVHSCSQKGAIATFSCHPSSTFLQFLLITCHCCFLRFDVNRTTLLCFIKEKQDFFVVTPNEIQNQGICRKGVLKNT